MSKCLILTDIHGCWGTLVRLLNNAPRGVKVVFAGDLIDRGPNSRAVVEFAMTNSIPTVRANHDDLCLDFYRKGKCHEYYDRQVWLSNGGHAAAANWPTIDKRDIHWRRDEYAGGRVPDAVLDWFESLPAYLYPSDELVDGRRLMVSHTGYGLDADEGDWFSALWARHGHDADAFKRDPETGDPVDDGLFRVFGHTYNKEAIVTDTYANIDTGAAYRGYGVMSAFLWPDKRVLIQRYDETPVEPIFEIRDGVLIDKEAAS